MSRPEILGSGSRRTVFEGAWGVDVADGAPAHGWSDPSSSRGRITCLVSVMTGEDTPLRLLMVTTGGQIQVQVGRITCLASVMTGEDTPLRLLMVATCGQIQIQVGRIHVL